MLLDLVQKGGFTDATATAFFSAAATIGSSYDLSRVLGASRPSRGSTSRSWSG